MLYHNIFGGRREDSIPANTLVAACLSRVVKFPVAILRDVVSCNFDVDV